MSKNKGNKTEAIEVVPDAGPIQAYDYGTDAGASASANPEEENVIPFLFLLQALSPQCKPVARGGVGASPGMIFNNVTEEQFAAATLIPVRSEVLFVEWVPRERGGGMVARHRPESEAVRIARSKYDITNLQTPDGNDLVQTFYLWCLRLSNEGLEPVVVPFSKTKCKPFRRWKTAVNKFLLPNGQKPPLFAHQIALSVVEAKNNNGDEYYNYRVAPERGSISESLLPPGSPLYHAARELYGQIGKGTVKMSEEQDPSGEEAF